jgi:hypothetical protein
VVIENIEEPVLESTANESASSTKDEGDNDRIKEEKIPEVVPAIKNIDDGPVITRLTFNDMDSVHDGVKEELIEAPKTIERLEEISRERAIQRRLEEDEEDEEKLLISADSIDLGELDIMDLDSSNFSNSSNIKERKEDAIISLDDIIELN